MNHDHLFLATATVSVKAADAGASLLSLINLDHLFLAVAALSGGLWVYYGVMRFGAEEKRRKPALFWRDIFLIAVAVLVLRLFFRVFLVHPDIFFLVLVVVSAALFVFFWWNKRQEMAAFWRDLFICFLLVFVLRGFFVDYFRIPSNSMLPTLTIGDVVLTDKNAYGYRLPVLGWRLSDGTLPARGEVVVFRKPKSDLFFIKRVVGVPDDEVGIAADGRVFINGEALALQIIKDEAAAARGALRLREQMPGGGWHSLYKDRHGGLILAPPDAAACGLRQDATMVCRVPAGRYFVLGDNRDHSHDSRYWGFVGREDMVGPAFRVLFNYKTYSGRWWLPLALEEK